MLPGSPWSQGVCQRRGEYFGLSIVTSLLISLYSQLALQTKFHGPLAYPPPYPPRPIFQRPCPPELSTAEIDGSDVQYETSFYKNTYAMVGHLPPICQWCSHDIVVFGCNDVSSPVLFSCDQARYHALHVGGADGVGSGVICAHSACAADAAGRASVGDMAGECRCRGAVLPSCLVYIPSLSAMFACGRVWRGWKRIPVFINPRSG